MDIKKIRKDFPAIDDWTYLDSAFVGLYPKQVREGYDYFLDQWMGFRPTGGNTTILNEWLEKTEKVRGDVAELMGVTPEEIAFSDCTGSGLNIVINGTAWKRGDNVVFPEWEHNPLDTYTLRKAGVESRSVKIKNGRLDVHDLDKVVDDRTRLIQVSQVCYINGFRMDLREVAEMAHDHGASLLVDATQAVGALATDYRKEGVDFVSAAPYKYLMGPAGLAFLYVMAEHVHKLTPDRIGWKNQIFEGAHAEKPSDKPEAASKFEYGTLHFQGMYGLEKSISYINKIGLGEIEGRDLDLSSHLWEKVHDTGMKMYTPEGTRSPVVSFYVDKAPEIASKLMAQRIKVTGREAHGGHIRVSPHFYNTREEIDLLVEKLVSLIH